MTKEEQIAWIKNEREKLAQKRQEAIKATGKEPFRDLYTLVVGENKISIFPDEPRTAETKFGDRLVLHVQVEGKDMDLMINPASPLWRDILEHMNTDGSATDLCIVRSGTGMQTRYSLK